jgi:hypothetical protein
MGEHINRNYLNRLEWNGSEDGAITDKVRWAIEHDVDTQIAASEFVEAEIKYQNDSFRADDVHIYERNLRKAIANLFTSDTLVNLIEPCSLSELRETFESPGQFVEFSVDYPYSRTV